MRSRGCFHAAIDDIIPDGHGDPPSVDSFGNSREIPLQKLHGPQGVRDTTR